MIKHKNNNYSPDYIVHPGITLSETLGAIGMSQAELSKRISRPETAISEIINGSKSITPETAIQLERALGIAASFWNNLEKNYQELRANAHAKIALSEDFELAKEYPYSEMAKRGWLQPAIEWEEKVENLLSFFGVSRLSSIEKTMPVAFRQHNGNSISQYAIQAWLRKGLVDSYNIQTEPFNKEKLDSSISGFKSLSIENPSVIIEKLTSSLAESGIALVFTQDLPKTYVCGAARWITSDRAMIQLSLRGSFADIMWFTLYHELGHLLLHSKKKHFVDLKSAEVSEEETEANNFASEKLIPLEKFNHFKKTQRISRLSVTAFARSLGIHPGIVVGRLQHENVIDHKTLNDMRAKYRFVNE